MRGRPRGRAWQRVRRERILAADFRCAKCGDERPWGELEVDHIRPLHKGGEAWDPANLQVLCRECHGEKTVAEIGAAKPAGQSEWGAYVGRLSAATTGEAVA